MINNNKIIIINNNNNNNNIKIFKLYIIIKKNIINTITVTGDIINIVIINNIVCINIVSCIINIININTNIVIGIIIFNYFITGDTIVFAIIIIIIIEYV